MLNTIIIIYRRAGKSENKKDIERGGGLKCKKK